MDKLDLVLEELRIIKAEQREHFELLYAFHLAAVGISADRVTAIVKQHSNNVQERALHV